MRILQVNHQFPPFSRQGSELHCWQLSRSLATTDEVAVFHISEVTRQRPRRLELSSPDGFRVFHCIDGGSYARLANWPNPFLQEQFQKVLAEWQPNIVHFHNYLSLGDSLPSIAREHGAVVFYTLHDFGLICPNNLLLRSDGQLCGKCHGEFFQDCCPVTIRVTDGTSPFFRHRIPSLARWQMFASQQSNPFVRSILRTALIVPRLIFGDPRLSMLDEKRRFFMERTRRIFDDVDRFISPSEFLRQRFLACGLPSHKIRHIRYGVRCMIEQPRLPSREGKLRFGYIGAFHAHKGLELLVRAFKDLDKHATLNIHGSSFGSPISESYWRRVQQQAPKGVVFHGEYRNDQLEGILATLDVVVVPSLWYENSPFTIQEAFQSGVPVITSDAGGMAELVRDGVDGLRFRLGDAVDLHQKMRSLIDDPSQLERFRLNRPILPTLETQSSIIRQEYELLLNARVLKGPSVLSSTR